MEVKYSCDPELHTACPKTNCYLHGGICKLTGHLAFAKQPVEVLTVSIPMSDEEYEEITRGKPSALSIVGPNRKTRRMNKNAKKD